MEFLAKSINENKRTSLLEHTNNVLNQMKMLNDSYGNEINNILIKFNLNIDRFWNILDIGIYYHDFGKITNNMQTIFNGKKKAVEVYHNYLSPCFITQELIDYYNLTKDEVLCITMAIAYHHDRRDKLTANEIEDKIEEIIDNELTYKIKDIKEHMNEKFLNKKLKLHGIERHRQPTEFKMKKKNKLWLYYLYVLLKGFLIKCDHIGSNINNINIENYTKDNLGQITYNFIIKRFGNLRDLQQFCRDNINNNVILIGSTGIGKMEGCLIWIDKNKGFLTIPLRVSINDTYKRIKQKIGYENIGVLHSTGLDYIQELDENYNEKEYENIKNLTNKYIVCTIDQVLKFVFRFKGYEKDYSIFAYSKIVIDEVQSYNVELIAIITKAIEMINNLGGKFMIMTATLPTFFLDEINKRTNSNFVQNKFILSKKRHVIKFKKNIINNICNIIQQGKDNKVLVVCNTCGQAERLYRAIKEGSADSQVNLIKTKNKQKINLLHSRFINEDRSIKETSIKEFSENRQENGIWIATQVVEASLDIDFDILHTEMSTLDALFQRMGRIFRSREYLSNNPNIYIYTKEITGIGYIYDKDIFRSGLELLKTYDGQTLTEDIKMDIIERLYSYDNIKNTEYYKKYKSALDFLDNVSERELTKKEVQGIFRNIDNVDVIPRELYNLHKDLFDTYDSSDNKEQKHNTYKQIKKYILSLNRNMVTDYIKDSGINGIYIIDLKYDSEIGIDLSPINKNK